MTSGSARHGPRRLGQRVLVLALIGITACGLEGQPSTLQPTAIVAPSGQIVVPPCPASAGCGDEFVVGDRSYGLICAGVDPTAVEDEPIARGDAEYAEVREIDGLPPHLWVAVRGDLPCQPSTGAPLEHEWYLVQGNTTPTDIADWGRAVTEIVVDESPSASP